MGDLNKTSILQMAKGAIEERVDLEMSKIIDNILDFNTSATTKRKLTLTVELKPDDSRMNIRVSVTAKSSLVPTNPVVTFLYIAGAETTGEPTIVEMVPNIPGQVNMLGEEQEAPHMLKLVK